MTNRQPAPESAGRHVFPAAPPGTHRPGLLRSGLGFPSEGAGPVRHGASSPALLPTAGARNELPGQGSGEPRGKQGSKARETGSPRSVPGHRFHPRSGRKLQDPDVLFGGLSRCTP